MSSTVLRLVVRIVACVLVLAGGLLHLKIWDSEYRDFSDQARGVEVVKLGFPFNAALSLVLAVALLVLARQLVVTLAALAAQVVFIVTLILSRTTGVLGWEEKGWGDDPVQVLVVEILAVVALAALAVMQRTATARAPLE